MINMLQQLKTANFFSRNDVTYLAHNCASPSFPPQLESRKTSRSLSFASFSSSPDSFVLPPRHFSLPGECFCVSQPRFCSRSNKSLQSITAKITRTASECNRNAQVDLQLQKPSLVDESILCAQHLIQIRNVQVPTRNVKETRFSIRCTV